MCSRCKYILLKGITNEEAFLWQCMDLMKQLVIK